MFIASLIIIAKTVSNQDVLLQDKKYKQTVAYICNGILFSDKNK